MTEISDWHLVQYLTEIVNQAEAAETHCDNYMTALMALSDEQWAKLMLHAKARAKKLRELLEAKDSSPLRARTVRNSLEHIDQRLDVRLLFGSTIFADRAIGPQSAIGVQNQDHAEANFRRIDPQTSEFWVLAHSASLSDLVVEMHRMSQIALSTIRTLPTRTQTSDA